MTTVDLNRIELSEFTGKEDARQHCKASFPLVGAHGSRKLATVYFEIAPGDRLGRHTDSAEELLIVLEGQLEATINGEKAILEQGELALVPELEPHDLRNTGNGIARVLGVFGGSNNIVATFEQQWLPTESNIVDTALLFGA